MSNQFIRGLLAVAFAALMVSTTGCAIADETAAVPTQPPIPAGVAATKVTLSAVIADGAKPLKGDILWIVARTDQGGAQVVAQQTGTRPELTLVPGRYLVTARIGDAQISNEIAIGDAAASHVLNFNSGYVRLRMIPNAGAPAVTDAVTWEVFEYSRAKPEDRKQITVARASQHEFVLPAGYYIVRAKYNDTTSELVVPVEAGHTYKYTVNLYAGNIGFAAVGTNGKTVNEPVAWEIVRATPNAQGELETVTVDVAPSRMFTLREGSYIVRARTGDLFAEMPFEVRAGKTAKLKVQLKPSPTPTSAGG